MVAATGLHAAETHAGTYIAGTLLETTAGALSDAMESESANARLVNRTEMVSAIPIKNELFLMIIPIYRKNSVCATPLVSRIVSNR